MLGSLRADRNGRRKCVVIPSAVAAGPADDDGLNIIRSIFECIVRGARSATFYIYTTTI